MHKPLTLTGKQVAELHDLIDRIERNIYALERDTRNLNNLFHFLKGDGMRMQEFRDSDE